MTIDDQRVEPDRGPERVGQERRQDQEGAVRDVDHAHDAEDQRQARREQRIDAADEETEDQRLDELRHEALQAYIPR